MPRTYSFWDHLPKPGLDTVLRTIIATGVAYLARVVYLSTDPNLTPEESHVLFMQARIAGSLVANVTGFFLVKRLSDQHQLPDEEETAANSHTA